MSDTNQINQENQTGNLIEAQETEMDEHVLSADKREELIKTWNEQIEWLKPQVEVQELQARFAIAKLNEIEASTAYQNFLLARMQAAEAQKNANQFPEEKGPSPIRSMKGVVKEFEIAKDRDNNTEV